MARASIRLFALVLGAAVFVPAVAGADEKKEADAILGRWITAKDASNVEISRCGEKYCGKIVSLKDPTYGKGDPEEGKPLRDRENPDDKLKTRPLIGLPLLEGFTYEGDGTWEDGTIYDPENGKTYKCIIKIADGGKTLKVRGFIGISLIGRTTVWKRVEAPEKK
ncbi:MAG: DUF2147 domain-containing protein [Myxococcales bacterium]|jgi:uncharacterized protein (DUF2147 family)